MIKNLMHDTGRVARNVARVAVLLAAGVCTTVLSGCSTLHGSEPDRHHDNGVYIGAGVLVSQLKPDTGALAGTSVDDSTGSGGSIALGYDVNDRFSVESHLAILGDATIDPAGTIGYTVGGVSGLYYGLNDAQDRARRSGFAVFGRLGLGGMENETSGVEFERANDVHLLAGVGLEYGMSRGVGLRAELVAHESDAKYAQLGLVYRFGAQQRSRIVSASSAGKSSPVDDFAIIGPSVDEPPQIPMPHPKSVSQLTAKKPATARQMDADGDKVPDDKDQCPDTTPGAAVKKDGCPIFAGVVEGISFRTGSDILTAGAVSVLAGVADTLREYPDIRIIIEAHTDNQGRASDNLQLSKRRAIAVARYLVDAGISGSRLKAQAYGEFSPRASNATARGRAANRRVELSSIQ